MPYNNPYATAGQGAWQGAQGGEDFVPGVTGESGIPTTGSDVSDDADTGSYDEVNPWSIRARPGQSWEEAWNEFGTGGTAYGGPGATEYAKTGGGGGGTGGSFTDSGGAGGSGGSGGGGFPPQNTTTVSSYPPGGAAPLTTSIPYTPGQEEFQGQYLDQLSGAMNAPGFGYSQPDLTALLGGQAGQSPEQAVQAIYGAMEGDINRQRDKGAELMENRNISMGRSIQSGTATAGLSNFLQDFNSKAAANLAGNRLGVANFGLQATGARDAYTQNMYENFQRAGYGGRSTTQTANPYVQVGN